MPTNEQNITRNAIFYSQHNVMLYNDLKRQCNAEKINVMIADNLGTLMNIVYGVDFSIIFIDAKTKKLDEDFLSLLSRCDRVCQGLSIIIDGKENYEHIAPTIFSMTASEVMCKIPDIKRSVKLLESATYKNNHHREQEVKDGDITNMLVEYGFDIKLDGFKYIKSVIMLFLTNFEIATPLSRSAYPIVASIYNTKPENVERNIRNAIKVATKSEKFQQKLKNVLSSNPTNLQVINYFVAIQRGKTVI